jgi:hypothetical protein
VKLQTVEDARGDNFIEGDRRLQVRYLHVRPVQVQVEGAGVPVLRTKLLNSPPPPGAPADLQARRAIQEHGERDRRGDLGPP